MLITQLSQFSYYFPLRRFNYSHQYLVFKNLNLYYCLRSYTTFHICVRAAGEIIVVHLSSAIVTEVMSISFFYVRLVLLVLFSKYN
jgi:hypothetical protein